MVFDEGLLEPSVIHKVLHGAFIWLLTLESIAKVTNSLSSELFRYSEEVTLKSPFGQ